MNDRIKLAEAMGWKRVDHDFGCDTWQLDHVIAFPPDSQRTKENEIPDPFTDANDDYAVLEWARTEHCVELLSDQLHILIIERRDPTANPDSYGLDINDWCEDYQIGDYARAALKVLKP